MISGLVRPAAQYLETRKRLGRQLEKDFFGVEADFDSEKVRDEYRWSSAETRFRRVIELQESLPWNPRNPSTDMARTLFEAAKERLPNELRKELLLVCAIGTELDWCYGVDGFFVLSSNLWVPVTFDLKLHVPPWARRHWTLKANGYISADDLANWKRIELITSVIAEHLMAAKRRGWRRTRDRLWDTSAA